MASKYFKKAHPSVRFWKQAGYGKAGTGKTLTTLIWAEELAKRMEKRIAFIDTEAGSNFYAMKIPERKIHPEPFDFDRLETKSIMEALAAVQSINPNEHGVVVIDTMTQMWSATKESYTGKRTSKGDIPMYGWGELKKPYLSLMSMLMDGEYHFIINGREGIVIDQDEDGDPIVVGSKMKAEGETPHEPNVLARFFTEFDADGTHLIKVFFEKDRSGILTGKTFTNPTFEVIEPVLRYLNNDSQVKLGTPEEVADRDREMRERAELAKQKDLKIMYDQIENALTQARSLKELEMAWGLTTGKKTKLGNMFDMLMATKELRKQQLTSLASES